MARVSVSNCKNVSLRRDLKSLSNFVISKFLHPNVAKQIYLKIELMKRIDNEEDPVSGTCIWEDKNVCGREFTIELSTENTTKEEILQNLAHELVHLKQWAKGEKVCHERTDNVRYKGKLYRSDKLNYWEYPWEIEAYGWEKSLVVLWEESKSSKSKK